jgi:hypothetical protein
MSTSIGTLQPRAGIGHVVWPAAGLALVVAVTVAVIAGSLGRDTPREVAPSTVAANTPTELSAASALPTVGGTLANTPTEIAAAGALPALGGTLANTPTEIAAGSTQPRQDTRSSPVDGPIGFHPLP